MMQSAHLLPLVSALLLCPAIARGADAADPSPVAPVWTRYLAATDRASVLPDFATAGYHGGKDGIPATFPGLPTFRVEAYGAVANDAGDDQGAIEAAIRAAEAAGGGVVQFPPGEFLVNTDPEHTHTIEVRGSRIVLKGSGAGPGGTTIRMVNYMRKGDPAVKWGTPSMFTFKHPEAAYGTSFLENRHPAVASRLVAGAARGGTRLAVADRRGFQPGQVVAIAAETKRPELLTELFHGRPLPANWQRLHQRGVTLQEMTRVVAVTPGTADGGTLELADPLSFDLDARDAWQVEVVPALTECGFEDLHVQGGFHEEFVHHRDYIHDGGWTGVKMVGTADSWIRRCVFTDVNGGAFLEATVNSSILLCAMTGNRGHTCFNVTFGSRNLVGCNVARESHGGINGAHGVGVSHLASGNVVWRFASAVRGLDFHGTFPRNTLADNYESDVVSRHGGNIADLPNHLQGLIVWNLRLTGKPVSGYDFWTTGLPEGQIYSGVLTALDPLLVGVHGAPATFRREALGGEESPGTAVQPESLYEAQLALRLGQLPPWVADTKAAWEELRRVPE